MENDISYLLGALALFVIKFGKYIVPILIILYIRKKDTRSKNQQEQIERYNRMYNQDVKDRE